MRIRLSVVLTGCVLSLLSSKGANGLRHDPRTTAKKLSQGLEIDGLGKLSIEYKALHYNQPMFDDAKRRDNFMQLLNAQVWGRLGQAKVDFDLKTEKVQIPKGSYDFGINMTSDEQFSVVFWQGAEKTEIPLTVVRTDKEVPYLTIALMATDQIDTFVIESRCGPFQGTAAFKVPYLDPAHDHGGETKK